MKARINTYAFRETDLNSDSLAVLGSIGHQIVKPGIYLGTVFNGKAEVGSFKVAVDHEYKNTQVNVDLAKIGKRQASDVCSRETGGDGIYRLAPKGYLVLFVSEGPGGYRVTIGPQGSPDRIVRVVRPDFDSRNLQKDDLFIATLLRPGIHSASRRGSRGKCRIQVTYPVTLKKPYVPQAPQMVQVGKNGFKPGQIKVAPGQGIVFQAIDGRTSVTVSLQKADNGPVKERDSRKKRIHWQRLPRDKR